MSHPGTGATITATTTTIGVPKPGCVDIGVTPDGYNQSGCGECPQPDAGCRPARSEGERREGEAARAADAVGMRLRPVPSPPLSGEASLIIYGIIYRAAESRRTSERARSSAASLGPAASLAS